MEPFIDSITPHEEIRFTIRESYFDGRSPYQHIQVVELMHHGRTLILDGSIQSSAADEAYYHEALVQPAMLLVRDPGPRDVLILGGGEGATLREVLRHDTVERSAMVDLDQQVVDVCREEMPSFHDGSFDDPRATLYFEDAEQHLRDNDVRYDVIIFDIVDPSDDGPAAHLFAVPFFELLKSRLNKNGILTLQVGPAFHPHLEKAKRVVANIRKVFQHFALGRIFIPSFHGAWGIGLASDAPLPLTAEVLQPRIDQRLADHPLRAFDAASLAAMFQMPPAITRQLLGESH